MIQVYNCYSQKYEPMFEQYFRASAPKSFILHRLPSCDALAGYSFNSPKDVSDKVAIHGWFNLKKLALTGDGVILSTGVDFQWFDEIEADIKAALEMADVVTINDGGFLCPDFLAFRAGNINVVRLADAVINNLHRYSNDEVCLTNIARPCSVVTLGTDYWTIGNRIPIPLTIKLHHANFVVGFDAKMKLLETVRLETKKAGILWASER